MAKTQINQISPPNEVDREILSDFSAIIQRNFEELFEDTHLHSLLSSDPSSNAGAVGDIHLVDDGTSKYLVVRYSGGWFKTADLTAV